MRGQKHYITHKTMLRKTLAIAVVAAATMALSVGAFACTGIMLKSADGHTVMARTIEWAGNDNHNRYVVVPRGHCWTSLTPDSSEGRIFSGKYGYVGFAVEQAEFIVEGLNEKGLSAGLFYFPGYGEYEPFCPENKNSNIADLQLVSYILGSCATIDEVIAEIGKIHVHNVYPGASTAHWRFAEPGGRQVVLEIINRKCVFYENELGVLTNSPSLDWHLTNLNNYVNLTSGAVSEGKAGRLALKSLGGGSGFHGIPGDFTPPSRFVRAAIFSANAPILDNTFDTVTMAFHILNNFDIPIGVQHKKGQCPEGLPSATQITTSADLSGLKYYFKTAWNQNIRCIDLSTIDFKRVKYQSALCDPDKTQPVDMIKVK